MDIDLQKVQLFLIKIENEEYECKLVRKQSGGELVFETISQGIAKSFFNKRMEGSFLWNDSVLLFTGRVYSFPPNRLVVLSKQEFFGDRRNDTRLLAPMIPGFVKVTGLFRERRLEFKVTDISRRGIRLESHTSLKEGDSYTLEMPIPSMKKNLSTTFLVKRIKEKDGIFIHNCLLVDVSPESSESLNFYLQELEGRSPGRRLLEHARLDALWSTLEQPEPPKQTP